MICKFFVQGFCKKKDECSMVHDPEICRDFFLKGECRRRNRCRFKHVSKSGNEIIKGKNTENFEPSSRPHNMIVKLCLATDKIDLNPEKGDVVIYPCIFSKDKDYFTPLLKEIENCSIDNNKLWKLWHGDTHLIVDDKLEWKKECPTFNEIIKKLVDFFKVDAQATRFNLYRDGEWKPYHHDAAAVDPHKAEKQNITIGVSFGNTREIAFQYAKNNVKEEERATISFPLTNGSVYSFGNQVNTDWRHGVPKSMEGKNDKRISIIIWGKI